MNYIYTLLDAVLPFSWISYDFMKNALIAIILITPVLGLISTLVVNNRMAFFADTLGHSALTGVAIGSILGLSDPKISMIALGVIFAILLVLAKTRNRSSTDTTISVFSSTASALGIVLLATGGKFAKYSTYIVGDFLSISASDICLAAFILVLVLIIWVLLFNHICMVSINPTLAESLGINTKLIDMLFSSLLALVVTVSISWVGILIITSLLTLPAATARNLTHNIRSYTWLSVVLSLVCGIIGLIISFYINSATGATIVLALAICYFLSLIFTKK